MTRIAVSTHALERWNQRIRASGGRPITREDIADVVSRQVRRKRATFHRRGDGYALVHAGLKIIVCPLATGGWRVLTVWPLTAAVMNPSHKRRGLPRRGQGGLRD